MPAYFDYAATAPMRPEALRAYTEAIGWHGNPSAIHSAGQAAKQVVEAARETVAASLGADPVEAMFTSGGTEAVNTAIKGIFWQRQRDTERPVLLIPGGEHHATLESVQWLAATAGAEPVELPLDSEGVLVLDALAEALAEHGARTALLSMLWANNEVGSVQPAAEAVALAAAHGVPVHLDAVAAYGQLPIDFRGVGAAALSVSAHKIGGPASIGALLLRRDALLVPLLHGGGQQRRLRSGTMDAPAAAAFAAVAASAAPGPALAAHAERLRGLRDRLIAGVRSAVPEAVLRGADPNAVPASAPNAAGHGAAASAPEHSAAAYPARLPGNAHFTFPGAQGDSLLYLLDAAGFAVSTGSACQAGVPEISHVLTAMGLPDEVAVGALRLTLGPGNDEAQIDALLDALPEAYARARAAGLS